jgi:hypothetical protein
MHHEQQGINLSREPSMLTCGARRRLSMAEDDRSQPTQPLSPPGGGRQDHEAMRTAASLPVSGPASSETLAAGGGLEVPGREAHPPGGIGGSAAEEPIPGERDPQVLTRRTPGAMGGGFAGHDPPAVASPVRTTDSE